MRESIPPQIVPPPPAAGHEMEVLRPRRSAPASRYVDFVFSLDYLSLNSLLLKTMAQAMHAHGLSCLLVNASSVESILHDVRQGRLRPAVFLDLCSKPGDIFLELVQAMADAGVHTICHPNQLHWTHKAVIQPELEKAGIPTPATVVIKRDEPDRDLTAEERARVGSPCVIKPSFGVAGRGAVIGVEPTLENISKARDYNRQDDWLIQRMVSWTSFEDRPAYLRAYNVLGCRTLMWWSNQRGYSILTWDDFNRYDLAGTVHLIDQITRISNVEFFSSEIAITDADPDNPQRYIVIDYVNDQCDIDPQADPQRSPPQVWVEWICKQFAALTWRKLHGVASNGEGKLHLLE